VGASSLRAIVVTFNYRLNIFGFMGSSELSARTAGHGSGNFGIQDQRAAILWVKQHIGAFGGDGGDITIFGESAGGNSVLNHLAQPASFGLYRKAIIESGVYNFGAGTMASAEKGYQ
jgi:para-nitrobenzyl esterase